MKKTITIVGLFLLVGIVNAQWYQSYGVTNINDLSAEQCQLALKKATSTASTGAVMTILGVAASVTGYIVSTKSVEEMDFEELDLGGYNTGMGLMLAGGGIAAIGIPLWISGSTRKSQIEVAMVKFKDTSGIGFKIKF